MRELAMHISALTRALLVLGVSIGPAGHGWAQQEQNQGEQQQAGPPEVTDLEAWNYDDLYADGWSVDAMLHDTDVRGPDGDEIGAIENIIISESNRIVAVIAEVGGFWDIGDTHVSVPWDEVKVGPAFDYIEIPVREDSVGDYDPLGDKSLLSRDEVKNTQVIDSDLFGRSTALEGH
ncbi:PRC-barrel domain-containing protein [Roseibium salinum]|nr:PRC-barrel domain-containing protein [Roseibium salinum]